MGTTIALATSHLVPSSHVSQQINHHPVPLMSYYLCLQRASGWRLNFSLAPFPSACLLPVECGFFGFAPSVKDGLTASCKYAVPTIHHVDIFHRTFVFYRTQHSFRSVVRNAAAPSASIGSAHGPPLGQSAIRSVRHLLLFFFSWSGSSTIHHRPSEASKEKLWLLYCAMHHHCI